MLDGTPVIDVHHHFLPRPMFDELAALAGGRPRLRTEKLSLALSQGLHDVDLHLSTMEEAGVDAAVLTYAAISVLGPDVCRRLNDGLAAVQAGSPGRLWGSAHVDLQEPRLAPAELERCVDELGFRAVALPTSAPGGVALDRPDLDPLWEAVEGTGLAVLLHPPSLPTGASTDYGLERSCGRPFDTTMAVVRLLCGVLPRHPGIRFLAPHCGGTAPFLKGRIQMFFSAPGQPVRPLPRTQRELASEGLDTLFDSLWDRMFVDTAGNGGWSPVVRMTADVVPVERMCFGTDYPMESHSPETMSELVAMLGGLEPGARRAVASESALGLLGIEPPAAVRGDDTEASA